MMPQAGLTKALIQNFYPEIVRQMNEGLPFNHPGIEDELFFLSRISRGINQVYTENTQAEPEKMPWIVVVAHQTVIKLLIASTVSETELPNPYNIEIPNGSITPLIVMPRTPTEHEILWHQKYINSLRARAAEANLFLPQTMDPEDYETCSRFQGVAVLGNYTYSTHLPADAHH